FLMTRPIRLSPLATAVGLLSSAVLRAQQPPFTLEQVMSAPFPDELVAAPAAGAVAWVSNARGARNVWVAGPPDYQGKPVTSYAEDDGQEIGELQWTPDARAIAYVRGGDLNDKGEYPNPQALVAGVEQAVWIVPVTGGTPRRIGEGNALAVAPKGDRVAFLRRASVGRLPFLPGRGEQTWSIRVADVATGAGRLVWVADTGRGSAFREIVAAHQLIWGAGDRMVFPWEMDGWTHLHAVPVSGG